MVSSFSDLSNQTPHSFPAIASNKVGKSMDLSELDLRTDLPCPMSVPVLS